LRSYAEFAGTSKNVNATVIGSFNSTLIGSLSNDLSKLSQFEFPATEFSQQEPRGKKNN
jgi:hypothetical protein